MQALLVFKLIDFLTYALLLLASLLILLSSFASNLLNRIFFSQWDAHLRLIRRLKLTVRKGIHLLAHVRLYKFQLILLDELSEGIDLLLIEKCHKVVAEAAHLRISIHQLLLNVALLADFFNLVDAAKALELRCSLSVCALACHFLEDKHYECALILTLAFF